MTPPRSIFMLGGSVVSTHVDIPSLIPSAGKEK